MAGQHWRREEAALLREYQRASELERWQQALEPSEKKQTWVSKRTVAYAQYEAIRRTAVRQARNKAAPQVYPGDILDEMVMRIERQLTLPFISKRGYRMRRGW